MSAKSEPVPLIPAQCVLHVGVMCAVNTGAETDTWMCPGVGDSRCVWVTTAAAADCQTGHQTACTMWLSCVGPLNAVRLYKRSGQDKHSITDIIQAHTVYKHSQTWRQTCKHAN